MKQELKIQDVMKLEPRKLYKVFDISDFMAHTTAMVIKIHAYNEEKGQYIFSEQRKRKKYYLKVNESSVIIPFKENTLIADSETSSFCGNALLNFIGEPSMIREIIENDNLNPILDKSLIVAQIRNGEQDPTQYKEVPVFPDEAKDNDHVVIQEIIGK